MIFFCIIFFFSFRRNCGMKIGDFFHYLRDMARRAAEQYHNRTKKLRAADGAGVPVSASDNSAFEVPNFFVSAF